jgi:two-component system, OmpR family, sensor histidine kinase BaeS
MRRVLVFVAFATLAVGAALSLVVALAWHAAQRGPAFAGVVVVVIVGLVLLRGVRRFAGPLGDVMEAADRVAEGDYTTAVPERGTREVRRLARSFNGMTERLRGAEDRRRNLLADVTHELRTPLAVVRGNVEALIDGVYPADPAHLQPILDETEVMARLLEDLQTISTAEAGVLKLRRETVDPAELVRDVAATFRVTADEAGVTLRADGPDGLPSLPLDRVRIDEVFSNLVSNALRHTPAGGSITISAAPEAGGGGVAFTVADTGTGIGPEELPFVFERFAKSPSSRGSGLGLAIARSLVAAHGGTIAAESAPGRGTRIRIFLPVGP